MLGFVSPLTPGRAESRARYPRLSLAAGFNRAGSDIEPNPQVTSKRGMIGWVGDGGSGGNQGESRAERDTSSNELGSLGGVE